MTPETPCNLCILMARGVEKKLPMELGVASSVVDAFYKYLEGGEEKPAVVLRADKPSFATFCLNFRRIVMLWVDIVFQEQETEESNDGVED